MSKLVTDTKYIENLYGEPEEFIRKLREQVKELVPSNAKDVKLDVCYRWDYGNESPVIELTYRRPETKEEQTKRLDFEKTQEKFERKQYKKLKAKYGDK